MALNLAKCRLCMSMKLAGLHSIFTTDNSMPLSEMAMECASVKIYEGDGLPDKICVECIEKLSSAYIFKQQCEHSDQILRRNYVPPPGFSITPPPNRQSSDSGISNRTDLSNQPTPSSLKEKLPPEKTYARKRKSEVETKSVAVKPKETKATTPRVEELRLPAKRPRLESGNTSTKESDYEDNSVSQFSDDSDEPLLHKCKFCDKHFMTAIGLSNHARIHTRPNSNNTSALGENAVVEIPMAETPETEDDQKQSCEKCGKTFKLKIMLKRHSESCQQQSSPKELQVSLEDVMEEKRLTCSMCTSTFKTIENLEKHLRVVHAAVLKKEDGRISPVKKVEPVPCVFCLKPFEDYRDHAAHLNTCNNRSNIQAFICLVCKRKFNKKATYLAHVKGDHFGVTNSVPPKTPLVKPGKSTPLVTQLSNIEDGGSVGEDSRGSMFDDSQSQHSEKSFSKGTSTVPIKCKYCDKTFSYKKAYETHLEKHVNGEIEIKVEPPKTSLDYDDDDDFEDEDSGPENDDNTCDICEKQFSYKRVLLQHKRTKHNMSSGTKRAKIALKDCSVKCLICDISMKVSESNAHNLTHMAENMKPRNVYTCAECKDTFKSCSGLGNHIKLVHRLKKQVSKKFAIADLADFCEVVVTKTEPLDTLQSHSDLGVVPGKTIDGVKAVVDLSGFTCPICSKKMGTLISLKRHVNWHTNVGNSIESKHECFVCKMTFKFNCHYKLHMREHYHDTNLDPKFLTCTICNRKSKHLRAAQMHMKYHNQTRFNTKDYQCSICKRVFQFRKVYLSHMAIHYKRGEGIANTVVGDSAKDYPAVANGIANQCPHCGKVCETEASLKCHIIWHKSKGSLYGSRYECEFCNLIFTNKKKHELHIRTHYEDENGPYKCTICSKAFIDEDYYRRHVKGHNFDHQSHKKRIEKLRMNKVKCPICTRYYPDLVKLIRHLRRTHPESKMIKTDPDAPPPQFFPCKLCAKVFQSEKRLKSHEESHLRRHQFFKCKFCNRNSMSLKFHRIHIKTRHLTQKYTEEPLKCYKCEETFVRGYALHHHLQDAHGINETWIADSGQDTGDAELQELQCAVCYKVLASKGNFERHIDYHNLLRCNYCFNYFSSLKFLEGHLAFSCTKKKLIGETEVYPKKVKCHICYKAFHVQVKLDCHLRTKHNILVKRERCEKQDEIVCDYCFRVFENEDALNAHKLYHRTIGYFGCIYCNRKFNTLTTYRKHKNHHFAQLNVDNPTKCEHCDETFVAFREMIYHMRDEHGDDKDWVIMPKESIEEKCNICNKIFFNVQRHLQYHEENRCKKCGQYFMSRIDFDNHLCSIESDEDPDDNENDIRPRYEECTFCFKPITKGNSKLQHDLIHKNSGSISCRFCALKFKTMDAFNIHAFSHRNRKYKKNPLKCRKCNEKFIQYGPFIKHLRAAHKMNEKMHYRTTVLPERCVVCGDKFPNLHNHYRAHLQHQCQTCLKYFTSNKVFLAHECDKEDESSGKVFTCDENLTALIKSYIPKDEQDDQKYYGNTEEEDTAPELHDDESQNSAEVESGSKKSSTKKRVSKKRARTSSAADLIQTPFVISDVLSLYSEQKAKLGPGGGEVKLPLTNHADSDDDVVIIDDDSGDGVLHATITIDDDD